MFALVPIYFAHLDKDTIGKGNASRQLTLTGVVPVGHGLPGRLPQASVNSNPKSFVGVEQVYDRVAHRFKVEVADLKGNVWCEDVTKAINEKISTLLEDADPGLLEACRFKSDDDVQL